MPVSQRPVGKNVAVDVPVLGNCKRTLSLLTELIQPQKHEEWIASFKPYEEKEFTIVPQVKNRTDRYIPMLLHQLCLVCSWDEKSD